MTTSGCFWRGAIQPGHIQQFLAQQLHGRIASPPQQAIGMKYLPIAQSPRLHPRIALSAVERKALQHGGHIKGRVQRLGQGMA